MAAMPKLSSAASAVTNRTRGVTLYHYGSFDPWAFPLAFRRHTFFVFHNVTPAKYLWKWNPLTALRAVAATVQLWLLPRKTAWVAVSRFNAEALHNKGFHNVARVPCAIPALSRAEKTSQPSLLFVGRIVPNKNVLQLLDLYSQLVSDWSADAPRLVIVGSRRQGCRYGAAFQKRYAEVCRSAPVIWHDEPLSTLELQRLYASSWLYVSASEHEGFGVPVMEAIAAGTPALYLPCGGTESVLEGVGCVRSAQDLVAAVAAHLKDETKRTSLLAKQQEFASKITSSSIADALLNILDSTASGSQSVRALSAANGSVK
jgi:glycosyltransferase involved in cell wall biosynthesis